MSENLSVASSDVPVSSSRRMSTYFVLASSQIVSIFGSELTAFVLGVWVYQQTLSATAFSFMAFVAAVPSLLMTPIAGALVDRWDRRWAIAISDLGAAIGTSVLIVLAWNDLLSVAWIYVVVALSAAAESFQFPAFNASIPLLVPKKQLGRANGFMEIGASGANLLAPLAAGALLGVIGLTGVFMLDLVTFSVALVTLLFISIPKPPKTVEGTRGKGSLVREALSGWTYIRERPGLFALMGLFVGVNFANGFVMVLLPPLVLSFSSAAALGTVMSVAGLGLVLGGLYMSITGGPRRRVRGILLCLLLQGSILFLGGVQPSVTLVAVAAFFYSMCSPIVFALSNSIWQAKAHPDIQGRVFAMRRLVGASLSPLAFLVAGPLADYVFEPLMAVDGPLAGSVGQVLGTGTGRGIGLLFIFLGVGLLVFLALAASYPRLRNLERDVPDALPDDPDDLDDLRDEETEESETT